MNNISENWIHAKSAFGFVKYLGLIIGMSIPFLSFGQTSDEKAVAAAVEKLRVAMIDGDRAALTDIASDAISYGHSGGTIEDKAAFVEAIAGGRNNFSKIDQTKQTIRVAGNAAIVRHIFTAEVVVDGKSASPNIGIMQVWQKEKGQWKLLARQAYKL